MLNSCRRKFTYNPRMSAEEGKRRSVRKLWDHSVDISYVEIDGYPCARFLLMPFSTRADLCLSVQRRTIEQGESRVRGDKRACGSSNVRTKMDIRNFPATS